MSLTKEQQIIGQKVKLTSNSYTDSDYNPIWGGCKGKIEGQIDIIYGGLLPLGVKWSNGCHNSYAQDDLDILVPVVTQIIQSTKPIVNTVSIKDAVVSVINSQFIANKASFSGYDVTSAVRKQVNDGTIRLDGVPFENINGKNTQRVSHDDIRAHVRAHLDTVSSYDRKFNGDYIVYSFNGHAPASVPVAVLAAPTARPTLVIAPNGVTSTAVTSSDLTVKLTTYISGKNSASLKQIQSRFKGEPVTVRDIASLATKAGLRIDFKTPYHASVVTK